MAIAPHSTSRRSVIGTLAVAPIIITASVVEAARDRWRFDEKEQRNERASCRR
jgi:hypothetical protein